MRAAGHNIIGKARLHQTIPFGADKADADPYRTDPRDASLRDSTDNYEVNRGELERESVGLI
jgi:hypothetical protein